MNDLISRQAAIDALLEEVRLVDGYYVENDEVINKDDAIEAIRLLPPVQPGRCKELKQLRAEKDFSDPPDLESYKKGFIDGFNEGYKARERDAN